MTPQEAPSEFHPLIARLIDQAFQGKTKVSSQDLEPFHEWIEGAGYDWFLEGWKDELIALNLNELSSWTFSDRELMAYMGLDDPVTIDDSLRIQHARERIAYALDSGGEENISSIHRLLIGDSFRHAILGYRAESRGQAGLELISEGVFKTDQDFLDYLAQHNFVLSDGSTHISDMSLLGLWQK